MITQENIPYTADEIKAMVKTIEELRKKYNGALERAKVYHTGGSISDAHITEVIFPELNEDNDEKIRKELIEHIKANKSADYVLFKRFSPDNVIAWLEKQGKNVQPDIPEDGQILNSLTDVDERVLLDRPVTLRAAIAWLEKQGEKFTAIDVDKMVMEYSHTKDGDFGLPVNSMIRAYRKGIEDVLELQKDFCSDA